VRVNASTLILAQRTKLDALQEAARASGDLELLSLCTLALEEGPPTFDRMIAWVGGRVSEGERRTRVHVPAAEQYVVLRSDVSKRWRAGEVGARLQNDLPTKYGVELYLEEGAPTAQDRRVPGLRALKVLPRVFYFHPEEVAPFTEEMGYAPSGLWSVLIDGYPRAGDPLIAGESEQEAIATWKRHTRSRIPPSRLSAVPRVRSGQGTETTWQAPANVVLVSAAERTIGLTQAVQNRLEEGDRVPYQDFYASPLFRRSLAQARTLAEDEHIHLLSARYGLIQLWGWHTRVTSDDVPLNDMSLDERQAWARRVDQELLDAYGAEPRVFVVLAGLQYVQALQEWAPDGVRWTFEAEKAS
jgi:hypothetical protein